MLGAAASRPHLADSLSNFVRRLQIPFFNAQMGKGSVAGGSGLYMGIAALSERDYVHWAIDRADLIIAIGHDTVEKSPFIMGPKGPIVLHVGYLPATVEEVYFPHAELVGRSARRGNRDRNRVGAEHRPYAAGRGHQRRAGRSVDRDEAVFGDHLNIVGAARSRASATLRRRRLC